MKKAILAEKIGMTQIFNEDGVLTPVTVLKAGPCAVLQVKTIENDGYEAVQVGFKDVKEKVTSKDGSGKKVIRNPHGATRAGSPIPAKHFQAPPFINISSPVTAPWSKRPPVRAKPSSTSPST